MSCENCQCDALKKELVEIKEKFALLDKVLNLFNENQGNQDDKMSEFETRLSAVEHFNHV